MCRGSAAAIAAARNEFEAFQIVIPGLASNVNAVASDRIENYDVGVKYNSFRVDP
jgi:hypothetical protein